MDDDKHIREILRTKTWFGFDLDDTLHEFRNASRAATTHCLTLISEKCKQAPLNELQERYREVLRQGTSNAFVDGKPSHAYRRERLAATLDHFSIDHDLIDHLLDEYERVLVENLKLKPGASSLLEAIKSSGRSIVVITEGPQDAQERAIRDLGIEKSVNFLATTNFFGVAKTSGLFLKVLDHLDISPDEMAYVGDSMERDIVPARGHGVYSIHFDEGQDIDIISDPPSIKSLTVLENLLAGTNKVGKEPGI